MACLPDASRRVRITRHRPSRERSGPRPQERKAAKLRRPATPIPDWRAILRGAVHRPCHPSREKAPAGGMCLADRARDRNDCVQIRKRRPGANDPSGRAPHGRSALAVLAHVTRHRGRGVGERPPDAPVDAERAEQGPTIRRVEDAPRRWGVDRNLHERPLGWPAGLERQSGNRGTSLHPVSLRTPR